LAGIIVIGKLSRLFRGTVKHEMVHTLGFGHVRFDSWHYDVMGGGCNRGSSNPVFNPPGCETLSVESVIYIKAYRRTVPMSIEYDDKHVLAESHQGERASAGFAPEPYITNKHRGFLLVSSGGWIVDDWIVDDR
jgi:hypothetical protein